MLAYDYPLLGLFWTMLWFFLWIAWLVALFQIIGDIFNSDDLGGWGKGIWLIFVILLPLLGVLIYLIARGRSMTQRNMERAQAMSAEQADYIRSVAGSGQSASAEIESAKRLLDSGAITQAEYEALKAKALQST